MSEHIPADELLPCPFCGGKARIADATECGPSAYVVTCDGCDCSSRVYVALKDDVTRLLIEAWNKRVNRCDHWVHCPECDAPLRISKGAPS